MTSVIVYNPSEETISKEPRIFAENKLVDADLLVSSHSSSTKEFVRDGMTTQKWTPSAANGTLSFRSNTGNSIGVCDYVMLAGVNWATANASLTVKDKSGNVLGTVSSGNRDNQPVVILIDSADYERFEFEFTADSTLEVGEVYAGESLKFTRNVSVGYKPGRWDFDDEISFSRTENNQFGPSSIKSQGTTERFQFNFVPTSFMETTFRDFIDNYRGKPIGFLWDKNNTSHLIYGHWSHSAPTFTSSLFSSIQMEIKGVV